MTLGTYHYKHARRGHWPVVLDAFTVRVEVTDEQHKGKQSTLYYKVRLLGFHADGRGPDTVMTVRADKVALDRPAPPLGEVRLPYADD